MFIDDFEMTEEMWCEDCNQVVEAWIDIDPNTGIKELFCPNNMTHDLELVHKCRTEGCEEKIPMSAHYCPWCMGDLDQAVRRFKDALPVGMDINDAVQEAVDMDLF